MDDETWEKAVCILCWKSAFTGSVQRNQQHDGRKDILRREKENERKSRHIRGLEGQYSFRDR